VGPSCPTSGFLLRCADLPGLQMVWLARLSSARFAAEFRTAKSPLRPQPKIIPTQRRGVRGEGGTRSLAPRTLRLCVKSSASSKELISRKLGYTTPKLKKACSHTETKKISASSSSIGRACLSFRRLATYRHPGRRPRIFEHPAELYPQNLTRASRFATLASPNSLICLRRLDQSGLNKR